jgi:probable F420-dependent oxidoreductase
VRLAIASPVVTLNPADRMSWEESASIADLAQVAEAADRLGYDHLTCSEHVGLPHAEVARRGSRYWDPLATFGYLAAGTSRIRLATYVLVLAYHHPLEIAKRYGTLDLVSAGRLVLGVGVGTLEAEFELLGVPFADRGARADDAIRALRAALSGREPSYHGEFYDFDGFVIDPCAVQEHVPIWVGGRTLRSLRRAASAADGWSPFGVAPAQVQEWMGRVEVPDAFDVVLATVRPIEPIDEPDHTLEVLAETEACGATIAYPSFRHASLADYVEKLEAIAGLHASMSGARGRRH